MAQIDFKSFDIYTFEIPQFVQDANSGEFILLTRLLLDDQKKKKLDFKILPAPRAYLGFEKSPNALIFPFLDFGVKKKVLKTKAFYYKKDYLFYNLNNPLDSKRLCLTKGYPYDQKYIQKEGFEIFEASSDEACLKMLDRKRVDYFLCEAMSGTQAILNSQVKSIGVKPTPVSISPVYFAATNNRAGKDLIKIIDNRLDVLRKRGILKELFEKATRKAKNVLNIDYDPTLP